MGFPKLRRVNTVGIRYTTGQRDESHYFQIINNILGVSRDQIYGIAVMGPKQIMLKLHTFFVYNRLVKEFVGKKITLDNEHEIELEDLSTYKNRVRIQKVPMEIEDDTLKCLLERFGTVENISTTYKKFGEYDRMFSDERVAWMIVEFPIPSSLYIKDTETYIYFSYLEQPKTCHKCGSEFHMVNECTVYRTTKPKDRENAIDLDDVESNDVGQDHGNNNNRARQMSESSGNVTDSDFEDSRSALSADSETNNIILRPNATQPPPENENTNENANANLASGTRHEHTSGANFDTNNQATDQIVDSGESVVSEQNSNPKTDDPL